MRKSQRRRKPTGPPLPQHSQHPLRTAARGRRPGAHALEVRSTGDDDAWLSERGPGGFDAETLGRHAEWATLARHVEGLGRDPAVVLPRLADYAARVLGWNRSVSNLISRTDETRLVSRHLAESLEPAAWIAESRPGNCLDFGTGAGLPGVPLSIVGVGEHWRLVESRRPKILFLRKLIQEMKLASISPVHARLEDLVAEMADKTDIELQNNRIDAFTSRATMTLEPTLSLAAMVVRPGGAAYLWKGSRREAELAACDVAELGWRIDGEKVLHESDVAVIKFILDS